MDFSRMRPKISSGLGALRSWLMAYSDSFRAYISSDMLTSWLMI